MRILDVTPRLPFPADDGALICMYQAMQIMASYGHELHIVAADHLGATPDPLRQFGKMHVIQFKPWPRWIGAAATLFRKRPYTQIKKEISGVYECLDNLVQKHSFDLAFIDEVHMASYGSYLKAKYGIPILLRCHNVEHEIYLRHAGNSTNQFLRMYLRAQAKRWKRFEVEEMSRADACLAITERDRNIMHEMAPGVRVETLPAGVDFSRFHFSGTEGREPFTFVMLGNMEWLPNRDSAIWFSNEVLPLILERIPNALCLLIGLNPPLRQLPRESANFRIMGRVQDIREHFRRATIGLIPLRIGGGMRIKMIEMMASGLPIVSTSQGAEGNEALPGKHFIQADTAEAFAREAVALASDRAKREALSSAALAFVEATYSLQRISSRLESLIQDVGGNRYRNRIDVEGGDSYQSPGLRGEGTRYHSAKLQ